MMLDTVVIDPAEATEKLAAYERIIADERTAEDKAIAAGYRAAARGLPVISLRRTVAAGGFHEDGWPRIAVARADTRTCWVRWDSGELVFADRDDWRANRGALVGASSVRVPVADDVRPRDRQGGIWSTAKTIVPPVPPEHRPRLPRLRRRHILWEVEEWTMVPPRDPALIQHIRGDLWAVVAQWDLTRLERLVLAQ